MAQSPITSRWSEVSEHPPKFYKITRGKDGAIERQQVLYVNNVPDRRMLVLFPGSAEGANKDASADNFAKSVTHLIDHYGIDVSNTDIYTCSYYHPYPKDRTQENIDGLIANPSGYISEDSLVLARALLPLVCSDAGYDRTRFYGHKLDVETVKENISRLTCVGKSKGSLIATREIFHALLHLMEKEYGYSKEELKDIKPEMFGIGVANLFAAEVPGKQSYGIVFTDANDNKAKKYHPNFEELVKNASPTEGIRASYLSNEHTALCVSNLSHSSQQWTDDGIAEYSDPSGHKVNFYLGHRVNDIENNVPRVFTKALQFGLHRAPGELREQGLKKIMTDHVLGVPLHADTPPRPKALLWVESLVGSGHLNYAGGVAHRLAQQGYDVVMASGSRKLKYKDLNIPGVRIVDLPGVKGDYNTGAIETINGKPVEEDHEWRTNYRKQFGDIVEQYKPDVVITEFWPIRRGDFDFALDTVTDYRLANPDTKLFSLVRDYIPMSVEAERRNGNDAKAATIINQCYDGVLVHSLKKLLPLERSFAHADAIEHKLHYIGYITPAYEQKKEGKPSRLEGRDKVVITSGGTWVDYAAQTYDAIIDALPHTPYKDDDIIILLPETTPPDYRSALEKKVAGLGLPKVHVETNRKDFGSLIKQAKAVFCHGGNTIVETIDAGVRDIYVTPRMQPGEIERQYTRDGTHFDVPAHVKKEQLVRAAVFANAGFVSLLRPEDLPGLKDEVAAYAKQNRWASSVSATQLTGGGRKAAEIIDETVRPHQRKDRAYDG